MTTEALVAIRTPEDFAEVYSDFHKDAYGFRPRHDTSTWTVERWKSEFEYLDSVCRENAAREAEAEKAAVAEFEANVAKLIRMGAKDREAAIRWLHQSNDTRGDANMLNAALGLPWKYLK